MADLTERQQALLKAIGAPATVVIGGVGVVLITSIIAFKNKSLRNYRTTT